ncbi:hypothetical protein BH09ACT13_BH09ACT13_10680 [soil metagenome]
MGCSATLHPLSIVQANLAREADSFVPILRRLFHNPTVLKAES